MKRSFSNPAAGFLLLLAAVAPLQALTFEGWQAAHFTSAELTDPAVSGEAASPAGDGLSNLLKYAFDLDPHVPGTEGAPAPQFFGGALALNFLHRSYAYDLQYSLEASSDLFHWSIPNGLSLAAILPLAGVEQWTALNPYPWPADRPQFLRLRVTRSATPPLLLDPPQMIRLRPVAAPFGFELHWADRSNVETGYRVERQRVADGVWNLFAITGPDTIFYSDHTVQSGTAYNYRVRAMFPTNSEFPDGHFSGWSESGAVTPIGSGGGSGGGSPDPDPDTDNDTFKDSVDAYPHDSRRSRDLPVLAYVALDVSSAVTELPIQAVALDEQNTVAFAYEDATKLYAAVTRDGATVGTPLEVTKARTITYDIQVPDYSFPYVPNKKKTVTETATGEFSFAAPWYGGSFVNTAGHLTGTILYSAPGGDFRRVFIATTSTPVEIYPPAPSSLPDYFQPGLQDSNFGWASFLGNTDTVAGGYYNMESFVVTGTSAEWFADSYANIPGATAAYLELAVSSFNGTAAGYTWDYATYATTNLLWPSQTSLGSLAPQAVNDSGLVLGVRPSLLPGQNDVALSDSAGKLADTLPSAYRQQVRLPTADFSWINNQGDLVIGNAQILEGPEDAPVWSVRTILWRKATDELFIVQFPVGLSAVKQFNNAGCFTAIADQAILDAQGNPVLNAYNHPTYRAVAQLLVPVEFVTKGANGEFLPQTVTWNSVVPPQIEVTAASATLAGNVLTVSVAGKVTDATSDCTPTPGKQVASIFISGGAAETGLALTNSATADPADPWRPYKYKASFTHNLTIAASGPGDYAVRLRTSDNAGGLAGTQEVNIRVQPNDLTQDVQLQLPASFSPSQPDTIAMTVGADTATAVAVTLTETGDATHVFAWEYGSGTLTLTFAQTPTLTTAVDTLSATLVTTIAGQTTSSTALSYVETGAANNAFTVVPPVTPSYKVHASPGGNTHPGNFYPTIVRFPAAAGQTLINSGYKITIMEHDWSLKLKTYQGEQYAYVVNDNDKPVVFNPSLYAQTDIQTKKLTDTSKGFELVIRRPNGLGDPVAKVHLEITNGLIVYGKDISSQLNRNLVNYEKRAIRLPMATPIVVNTPAWIYSPKTGYDYKREGLSDVPTMIEREVLWRYVGTENTVAIFRTSDELDKDIAYRVKICQTARTAGLPGFPDPALGLAGIAKANPAYWTNGELDKGPIDRPDKKISWDTALANVFHPTNGPALYTMGCINTARCFHLLAANAALGETEFNFRRGGVKDPESITKMHMNRNAAGGEVIFPKNGGPFAGNATAIYDWLPGDWAEFDNVDIVNDPTFSVENAIYIGGCFEQSASNFKANAQFIGNPMGIVSMAEMIRQVSIFPLNGAPNTSDVKILPTRKMLRQPSL